MKKLFLILSLIAAAALVYAQIPPKVADGIPVSGALTAVNTDTAMFVRYVGTATSADIAVAAGGDLTFRIAGATDTTFECPVSGGLGGVIDVSDTACDTMGEVCDAINTALGGTQPSVWRCGLMDAMRADSSNDTLATISATEATGTDGLALKWDTGVPFDITMALVPPQARTIKTFITTGTVTTGTPAGGTATTRPAALIPNPWSGTQTVLFVSNATTTYASGTSNFEVWTVRPNVSQNNRGSETATLLYSVAGGATTANKVFDFSQFGLYGRQDEKLIVRMNNSAALSAPAFYAYGIEFKYR